MGKEKSIYYSLGEPIVEKIKKMDGN